MYDSKECYFLFKSELFRLVGHIYTFEESLYYIRIIHMRNTAY
jgi:hypothetical protein